MNKPDFVKKIKPFYTDERGEMSHLLDGKVKITSALLITCKKGAIRANHYHKKDTHYSFMLKGQMDYFYRDLNLQNDKVHRVSVKEGDIVYTPPNIVHAMKFQKKSVFLALTTELRERDNYEKDTIRVKLI